VKKVTKFTFLYYSIGYENHAVLEKTTRLSCDYTK